MDEAIGFEELRWLREVSYETQRKEVPQMVGVKLLTRGLVQRKNKGFTLTPRGRIALAKLG